jgi:hypothetical protein
MATATVATLRHGVPIMHNTKSTNLNEVARKIKALRTVSQMTNYSLSRTIGGMLDGLSEDELVKLGEILMRTTDETQHEKK